MNELAGHIERDPVLTEAAEWILELQARDVSEERIAAWQRWLSEDPAHRQAFDRLQAVQDCIADARTLAWPSEQEVAADTYDGAVPVSMHRSAPVPVTRTPRPMGSPWAGWMLAAGALAAGVTAPVIMSFHDSDLTLASLLHRTTLVTGIGELRRVRLVDGSTVTIDGDSRITIDIESRERDIALERGEAFFEVAKDAHRPFVVRAGMTTIRAVGTAFDVRRAGEDVTVAVAEGVVEVRGGQGATQSGSDEPAARVAAGQQLRLQPQHATPAMPLAADAVAGWREGRRQYLAEPLADVIADLSRYSKRRIVIKDAVAGRLAITGAVFERDIGPWLESLPAALPVEVTELPDGTVEIGTRE